MLKQEFEQITGWEVTCKDYYEIIEPLYMATNMTKQDFAQVLNRKRFDQKYIKAQYEKQLLKEMKELAKEMKALCGQSTAFEKYEAMRVKALEYSKKYPLPLTTPDFETAKGYCNYTYVTALVYYDTKDWHVVKRINLID